MAVCIHNSIDTRTPVLVILLIQSDFNILIENENIYSSSLTGAPSLIHFIISTQFNIRNLYLLIHLYSNTTTEY